MVKNLAVTFLVMALAMVACQAKIEVEEKVALPDELLNKICEKTRYKDLCFNTLKTEGGDSAEPRDILKAPMNAARVQVKKGIEDSKTIQEAKNDPASAEALRICKEVMEYAETDLNRTVDSAASGNMDNMALFVEDLRVWLEGSITYQQVCFDAFTNTSSGPGQKMVKFFNATKELTSNALTVVTKAKELMDSMDFGSLSSLFGRRRLLEDNKEEKGEKKERQTGSHWIAGEPPQWVDSPKRKVMNVPVDQIKADLTVSADGKGDVKTIKEAIEKIPKKSMEPFVIRIKAGTYKESNVILKHHWNVILVGDGADKTVLSGNLCTKNGVKTIHSATLGVDGEGFMARDIKFENTAGPEGEQAVALRAGGDFSVFHKCKFEGAQDTLYAMKGRQFYRDCTVSGTVDFIFGNAQAVFQNVEIIVKKPLREQDVEVTAQSRQEPNGPGAFVFQGCKVTFSQEYKSFNNTPGKGAYLGRPWKGYARAVFMNSFIDEGISPEGWHPWPGRPEYNDTVYFGEFENKGPGSDTSKRVKWRGVKKMSRQDADNFTPGRMFVKPDSWIPNTGVPFEAGKYSLKE